MSWSSLFAPSAAGAHLEICICTIVSTLTSLPSRLMLTSARHLYRQRFTTTFSLRRLSPRTNSKMVHLGPYLKECCQWCQILTSVGTVANDKERNASVLEGLEKLKFGEDTANTTVYGSSYAAEVSSSRNDQRWDISIDSLPGHATLRDAREGDAQGYCIPSDQVRAYGTRTKDGRAIEDDQKC